MSEYPKFSMALNVGRNDEERIEAFEMYQKAFNAKKISESTPPEGNDIHIMIEINGLNILLAPGGKVERILENAMCCEFQFANENDLHKAYDILINGSLYNHIGSYPWAPVGAFITDKFGVCWWLRT
jgi:PhnB protein